MRRIALLRTPRAACPATGEDVVRHSLPVRMRWERWWPLVPCRQRTSGVC